MVFDYMKDHSSAWKFGQWMNLINPFNNTSSAATSAVGAARLAK